MKGPLALVGGDEFRPGCEELDRAVLDAAGADKPVVLVLPTASANQGPQMAAANGVRYFSELGAEAAALMVLEPEHANDGGLISAVESAQAVYIAGGDPMHLLAVLKGSLLLDKLIDANRRGMAITGSSAGAMVMAAWMRYRDWTLALGLVPNVTVLPHHERSEPEQVMEQLGEDMPEGTVVLGIDARTGCVSGADSWTALGPGQVTVYSSDSWTRYGSGETFTL